MCSQFIVGRRIVIWKGLRVLFQVILLTNKVNMDCSKVCWHRKKGNWENIIMVRKKTKQNIYILLASKKGNWGQILIRSVRKETGKNYLSWVRNNILG